MATSCHASSQCCGRILRKKDWFGGKCLVTDAEFMWVKLVYGVMQKIAVGVVR